MAAGLLWVGAMRTIAVLVVLAGCAGADDEPLDSDSSDVAAGATLLVSADFAATSSTKTIVQNELAHDGSIRLIAIGDMSYAAPYAANDPWAGWAARTFPVMGNHEFNTVAGKGGQQPFALFDGNNAAGDHRFTAITGDNGVATFDFAYSHEITPGWLLVVLNSGTDCKQQSCTQQANRLDAWIRNWRTSHGGHGCVIVALHTARWSTMFSGDPDNLPWATSVAPLWTTAVADHADIVLQGHVHVYEEFKKIDGVKLFTVGAGGRGQVKPLTSNIAASALVASHGAPINGVLKLALYDGSYGYRFETAATTTEPASKIVCNDP